MASLCFMTRGWGFLPSRGAEPQAANDLVTSVLEAAASGSTGTGEVGTLLEQLAEIEKKQICVQTPFDF